MKTDWRATVGCLVGNLRKLLDAKDIEQATESLESSLAAYSEFRKKLEPVLESFELSLLTTSLAKPDGYLSHLGMLLEKSGMFLKRLETISNTKQSLGLWEAVKEQIEFSQPTLTYISDGAFYEKVLQEVKVLEYKPAVSGKPAGKLQLRLQFLHTTLQNIQSPEQLTDTLAELGCIFYELLRTGQVSGNDILQELGKTAQENSRLHTSDVSDHAYLMLAIQAAADYSSRQRLLLRTVPDATVPQWTVHRSVQTGDQTESTTTEYKLPETGIIRQTNWGNDYAEQGFRFALFVGELLEQIQPVEQATAAQVTAVEEKTSNRKTNKQKGNGKTFEVKDKVLVFYCALKKWHKYGTDGFLNGPAPNKELASLLGVTRGAISKYFNKLFIDDTKSKGSETGYDKYCKLCSGNLIEHYFHQREGKFSRNRQLNHDPADTAEADD